MLKSWREVTEMVRGLVFLLTVGVVLPLVFYDYLGVVLGPTSLALLA